MGTFGVESKVKIKIIQYVCIHYITGVGLPSPAIMLFKRLIGGNLLECIEVKDAYSDMARQHGRQKSQAPTHTLKVKDLIKD